MVPSKSGMGKRKSSGFGSFKRQAQRLLSQVASSFGLTSRGRQRTVRFQQNAAVYEFL